MVAEGKAVVPANENRIAYATREDCAAAAAGALSAGHDNKAYEITGPDLIGTRAIARAASQVAGRPINIGSANPLPNPLSTLAPEWR